MSTNSNSPPGLILPTMKSFTPGAGNPRDSAMLAQQNMNAKQASLNASVGGKRRKRSKRRHIYLGGSNGQVIVPQFQMQYKDQSGTGTGPNDQIKANSSTSMQSTAWAANDHLATKMGGTKRRHIRTRRMSQNKKGGNWNPNWSWGCYSGGRKTRRKRTNKKRRV